MIGPQGMMPVVLFTKRSSHPLTDALMRRLPLRRFLRRMEHPAGAKDGQGWGFQALGFGGHAVDGRPFF